MPLRRLRVPALLFAVAVVWGGVQCLPVVPDEWAHPIWREAAGALGIAGSGVISADPEKTVNALIRLMTYVDLPGKSGEGTGLYAASLRAVLSNWMGLI
ncbi:hypothetical protein [Novispirillum itersonii]|uniref:Uncharacterized protein n=1 Tax=Novispirillum itersonii TaxID=189 RepID=A0A7X0DPK8_NOVIT|nr:hypothetical protein [Novispirillum itersonii]MBB6211367.1 hypothetical protein [Novispirillum itersonii]